MPYDFTWFFVLLHVLLVFGFGARILLRADLRPDVRMGWLVALFLVPYISCILYYLFGEVALRRGASSAHLSVAAYRHSQGAAPLAHEALHRQVLRVIEPQWQNVFSYAASINHFAPQPGHQAVLMADGEQARARMLADFDAAQSEIHVLYYIWLDDQTGRDIAHALMRASRRGVKCRAMVDGLGSRALLATALWQQMQEAGVDVGVSLPLDKPLKVLLTSRIDLRNHRKITLIDRRISYVGSQNCADAAFLPKAAFAPWVDIMLRIEGPVVQQMQWVFSSDWNQAKTLAFSASPGGDAGQGYGAGFAALTIAEGPSESVRSTSQLLSMLLASAGQEVVISTPYFVPDATVVDALSAAARRSVAVTLILPARNDSAFVAGASRSYYYRLLSAGVKIYEFKPGLLHAKTLTVDRQVCLLGSTNLDLRSFDLNFENNILLQDASIAEAVRARQNSYIADSEIISLESVKAWPWWRRIWNNLLATLSPVL